MSYDLQDQPEWLKDLLGDSPVLSDEEWHFIAEIRNLIAKELKCESKIVIDSNEEIKWKLSLMKNNLKQIVYYLKKNRTQRQHFVRVYPKWRMLREMNIQNLVQIANSIEDFRLKCQVGKFVGGAISLIGGVLTLFGAAKDNRSAEVGGCSMMGIGGLTYAGASLAECGSLLVKIDEAKKILKRDQECVEHLWDWLDDGSHCRAAMEHIRDVDIEPNVEFAAKLFHDAHHKKRSKTEMEKFVKEALSLLNVDPKLADQISDVIGILVTCSILYDRYRPLFDLALSSFRLMKALDTCVSIFRAALAAYAFKSCGRVGLTAALKGNVVVGIVLDAISLALTRRDSQLDSEQVSQILKASDLLKKHAQTFEEIYNDVKKFDL